MTDRHDERSGQLPIDPVLREFVRVANTTTERVDEGQPLTLYVNGAVVSGWLIPNWQWFQEQAESFQGDGLEIYKALAENLLADAREYRAVADKLGDLSEEESARLHAKPPQFICLKDARVFIPGPTPSNTCIYWVGRLASVDAWNVGILNAG